MPTIGSITKTVRITQGDLAIIEGLMSDGTSWSRAIHKLCEKYRESRGGTPKMSDEDPVLADIEVMARFGGLHPKEFYAGLNQAMNDGMIYVEDGEIKVCGEVDTSDFTKICADKGLDPNQVMARVTERLMRGEI